MASVQVTVLFFAKSRELTGQKSSLLEIPRNLTARELLDKIVQAYPSLSVICESVVLSHNEDYLCIDDTTNISVQPGDTIAMDHVEITENIISIDRVTSLVTSPACGAISTFIGTTRDNFNGKKVVRLEYESYDTMAKKEMEKICTQIHAKWNVGRVAMIHRIGEVPITEASVIIAVSSPHRQDSLEAVKYGIDTLKETVPIWKKEIYEDGTCSWKENSECCFSKGK